MDREPAREGRPESADRPTALEPRPFAILEGLNEAILRCPSRDAVLEAACRVVLGTGGFRFAAITLSVHDGRGTLETVAHGEDEGGFRGASADDGPSARARDAAARRAIETGAHVIPADALAPPGAAPSAGAVRSGNALVWAAFPIREGGAIVGALTLGADEPRTFTPDMIAALDTLAMQASLALDNLRLATERERAESACRETDARVRAIADLSPVGIFLAGTDGRILFVNRAIHHELGIPAERAIDGRWTDFVHPDDRQRLLHDWRQYLAGESPASEGFYRVVRTDRSVRLIHVKITPVRVAGRLLGHVGTVDDITERKQASDALREGAARLQMVVRAANVGLWDWDLRTNEVFYSPEWKRQIGYEDHEIANELSEWQRRVHPDDLERTMAEVRGFIAAPRPDFRIEFRFRHRDGSYRQVLTQASLVHDERGVPVRLLGSQVDITERQRVETALQTADRQLATILESVSDAFVALDGEWKYTYVNQRAGELFGRRPEDLLGRHIWTEFPEGVGQPFYYAYQQAAAERLTIRLEEYYEPWGRWFENRIYPTDDGLAIYFTDVTERKQAEALLTGQKRVLEMIADGAPLPGTLDALLRLIEAQSPDMLCSILLLEGDGERVRHAAAPSLPGSFTGAIDGAAVGERAGSCGAAIVRRATVIAEDIAADPLWTDYRALAAAHGLRACWSTPILDAEDRVLGTFAVYYRAPGRPTDRHVRLIDIATHTAAIAIARSREEDALRASEARYRCLVEISPDAIYIDRGGRIVFINAAGARLLGAARPEDVLGTPSLDLVPAEDLDAVRARRARILAGQSLPVREERIRRIDGRVVDVEVASVAMTDAEGQAIQGVLRDITERKRAADELRALASSLEARVAQRTRELADATHAAQTADRLKSVFLATMSHELRTPLNSILGFTGVLLQELAGPLNPEQRKQLGMTRDSARHLLALINDVLDISKIEAGEVEFDRAPFDVRSAIESILRSLAPEAQRKGLSLVAAIDSTAGVIVSDRRRVEQVLLNLVNNAIKFTERGEVRLECAANEGWLETRVRDTGIGIKREDTDKLFKPFQQIETGLNRRHEGTGLGLMICRRLVTLLGGGISVESEWGVGSTFTVTLPLDAPGG